MDARDKSGWAPIHQAAFHGFMNSVERFILMNADQLELETGDELNSTPLLLCVMSGRLESVEFLVGKGANLKAINTQNHGVVELCCLRQYVDLLEFFIEKDFPDLPVWKLMFKFLASELDEESEPTAKCMKSLTQPSNDTIHPNWQFIHKHGGVPVMIKVVKSDIGEETKINTFHALLNIIEKDAIKDACVSAGAIPPLIKHFKLDNAVLIKLAANVLKEICKIKKYGDQAALAGAIPSLLNVIKTCQDEEALVQVVLCLAHIADSNKTHQSTIGTLPESITSIVNLFDDCTDRPLLMALTTAMRLISAANEYNQAALVDEGVSAHVITLMRVKYLDLQLNAVEAVRALAEKNTHTQKTLINDGAVMPLMTLLRKSRAPDVQEKTAGALWSLAGDYIEEQRAMGEMITVNTLIEFLSAKSEKLHLIGSHALGVLAQGPMNKQNEIGQSNGVHPLVRLLTSNREHIVLSVIQTLRYLCVGVGYAPHTKNQTTLSQSRGIKFLVALMVHPKNEIIQVEAAHTLACAALGHQDNLDEILLTVDFSYVRILKMMYSQDPLVRLIAGQALAAFSYNSLSQQKKIAEEGGVRYNCFEPFLSSDDEYFRCLAAFQIVILSRIIPDEEQAISSARGIKVLVDLLFTTRNETIQALGSDCVARLGHTRAGVPAAIVSIRAVTILCRYMLSDAEQVRGSAAIALGYLSYNHQAERELLNQCRRDPFLKKVLNYYMQDKLAASFVEGWNHFKRIGLPPIELGRPSLVGKKTDHYMGVTKADSGRPMTILSMVDGERTASNLQSSPFMGSRHEEGTHITGRSSRASRASHSVSFAPRNQSMGLSSSRHSPASNLVSS